MDFLFTVPAAIVTAIALLVSYAYIHDKLAEDKKTPFK